MARAAKPEHAAPIAIQILNWRDYVGESRGQIFTKIPNYFHTERGLDLPADLWKFFFRLIYLAATQRTPGIIRTDAVGLSRETGAHPQSVISYLPRLIQLQLIQQVSESHPPRREENRGEEIRGSSASSFPDWLFEHVGLVRYEKGDPNRYLTREKFAKELWQAYPKPDSGAFDDVYAYLQGVVYDERWLAFTQTCLRNYIRQKRKHESSPAWHSPQKFFLYLKWWNYFRNEDGSLPFRYSGGQQYVNEESLAGTGTEFQNIIYPVRSDGGESVDAADTRNRELTPEERAEAFRKLKASIGIKTS